MSNTGVDSFRSVKPATTNILIARSLRISKLLSTTSVLFPFLAAIGWVANIPFLKQGHPALPAMQPNTAIALLLSAFAIFLITETPRKTETLFKIGAAILIMLFGSLTLSQYIFGWNLGIDQIITQGTPTSVQPYPGRASPQTSLNFVLVGFSILVYVIRPGLLRLGQLAIIVVGLNAIIAMTGYIFSTEQFYGFPVYVPAIGMAINTAFSFLMLSLAILFSRPAEEMMSLLNSATRSGAIARQIFFTAIAAPPLVGLATRSGVVLGLYDSNSHRSLFVVIVIGIILRTTWKAARTAEKEELHSLATTEKLRISQEQIEMALSGADLASWDWNIKSGLVHFNARWADMRGYQPSEITPHVDFWLSGIHPEDLSQVQTKLTDYFSGKTTDYQCEFRVKTKSGEWLWVLDKGKVFEKDSSGQPIRMVGTELDITEQKLLEKQLKREIQTREEVLAIVSHDLKNPLSSIDLTAQLLQMQNTIDIKKLSEYSDTIRRSTKQMQRLIGDLLDLSKIESGTFSVDAYAENLGEILDSVLNGIRIQAESKKIRIHIHVDSKLPAIAGDAGRLSQVFANLLGNAVKFTHAGGQIRLVAKEVNKMIEVEISDSGPGIPKDQFEKVFEKFWQAEKTKHLGSGLGLAIAKGIIDSHGGKIWIESELGKGCTFHFSVPVANENTKVKAPPKKDHRSMVLSESLKDIKVLIVDDSPDMLLLMRRFLESAGAKVTDASSADEALTKLSRTQPDVLITDIEMPGENGYALIDKIHRLQNESCRNIPIAALTAHDREEDMKKIKEAGFNMKLSKPVDLNKLIAAVKRLASHPQFLSQNEKTT